jgi:SulP family sulfate permease
VSIRVDESLYFANASYLESAVYAIVAGRSDLRHIILQCTAVNEIDLSALETLEQVDHRLREQGIALHLSEVKGPVMDALRRTDFIEHLSGQVYLSQHQAVESLRPMGGVTAGTETTPESVETAAD